MYFSRMTTKQAALRPMLLMLASLMTAQGDLVYYFIFNAVFMLISSILLLHIPFKDDDLPFL